MSRRPPQGRHRDGARAVPGATGELLAVGLVTRAHGLRGEVAIQPLSEVQSRFLAGSVLRLGPGGETRLTVESARSHGHRVLVKFKEVGDREEADSLRGLLLLVPSEDAPPLPPDRYWVHEVVGLEVLTEAGRSLGRIREVLHTPGNDVWLVESDDGEVLIPAIRDVVVDVDLSAARALIREIPGLLGEDS